MTNLNKTQIDTTRCAAIKYEYSTINAYGISSIYVLINDLPFLGTVLFQFHNLKVGSYYNEPKFKCQPTSGTGRFSYKIWTNHSETPMVNLLKNLKFTEKFIPNPFVAAR